MSGSPRHPALLPAAALAADVSPADGRIAAVKVEHPVLPEPAYFALPADRAEIEGFMHGTVLPWVREMVGESREPATFTEVLDHFGPEDEV